MRLGSVEVPSRVLPSGLITKRARIPVYGDDPRHYSPLVALALNPESIEFLISELQHDDGFTKDLEDIRDEMRETLWNREAGIST